MNATDFECVAYDGAIYCTQCLPEGVDSQGEDVTPVFASNEVDSYPVCDACGREHDYMALTEAGQLERLADQEDDVIEAWDASTEGELHGNVDITAEHGGWWIICKPCGASWSAAAVESETGEKSITFERVDQGDGSCEE